jgi:NTE family protein
VATWLNPWGAELRTIGRIGNTRGLGSELMQPLVAGSPWFLSGSLQYDSGGVDLFNEGRRVQRIAASTGQATLAIGRRLASWGDVRLGFGRLRGSATVEIPADPAQPASQAYYKQGFAQLRIDTLDSLGFPSRGNLLEASWQRLSPDGAQAANQLSLLGLSAFRAGAWAGHLYGELAHSAFGSTRSLGGFLRLSGTADNSLDGNSVGLARLVMARRIGRMPIGVGGTIRAGFSLEAGSITQTQQSLRVGQVKLAGSGFLSVDTRFGPFYLAAGATRDGEGAFYLYLGPIW